MKVLLVSNIFPNSAEEERGVFTYRIAMALKARCRLEVAAPLQWVPPPLRKSNQGKYVHVMVPEKEEIGGLTVHHPRYGVIPGVLGFMNPMFMSVPLLRLIKRLDRKEPIDLINAHWIFPDGVAAAWAARRLGKPVVLTALGCDINFYPSLHFRKGIIKQALRKSDAVTVKGNSLKEKALKLQIPNEKIHVIPNGIDLLHFRIMDRIAVRRELNIRGKGPFLLTVGSLDEVKGNRFLLEALRSMVSHTENPPHLIMVGEGPLKQALSDQAKSYGLADRITFPGKRPHHEIPLWMNAADLFCLPSIREGRPNVLIEALACGTPAVASHVGSVPEIIHDGNGRMARAGDSASFRFQILYCLNQRWDREAIRQSVSGFTWDDCAALYMKLFRRILQNRRYAITDKSYGE
jgi:teichuronic acid biosynthesis glycosyltransferase TuaC